MTVLYLVRHGQTAVNRSGSFQGRLDAALTERGVAQALAAAEVVAARVPHGSAAALAAPAPIRVVASPLVRARRTAELVAKRCGIADVRVDERWIELDYGEWDGRPLSAVSPEEWAHWRDHPEFAPPAGESLRAVTERVRGALDEWIADPVPTIAVSHVSPIKAAVALVLGTDEAATWRMHLDLASVTTVLARGRALILSGYNAVGIVGPEP